VAERRTIEPDEARRMLGAGEAGAIDLRDPDDVAKGHAPAAVPVIEGDLEGAVEQALHGREAALLIFGDDEAAIERLESAGHETIVVEGGWERWQREGHPVLPRPDDEYEGPDLMMPTASGGGPPETEREEEEEEDEEADADSAGPEGEDRAQQEEPVDSEAREEPAGNQPAQEPRE
jgi:rhodanese-related sulfurtransferase